MMMGRLFIRVSNLMVKPSSFLNLTTMADCGTKCQESKQYVHVQKSSIKKATTNFKLDEYL
jgi:hypothetical protein